ncbi:hypothetical protein LP2241_20124 [Pseudolactococcus piscium]|nr:hypothetical protein LP2241_20124 [Lactococcus piscium]
MVSSSFSLLSNTLQKALNIGIYMNLYICKIYPSYSNLSLNDVIKYLFR